MTSVKQNLIPHLIIAIILFVLWLIDWLSLSALIAVLIINFVLFWAIRKAKAHREAGEHHSYQGKDQDNA